jgi:hypothetical protein
MKGAEGVVQGVEYLLSKHRSHYFFSNDGKLEL